MNRAFKLFCFFTAAVLLLSGCVSDGFKQRIRQQEAKKTSNSSAIVVVIIPRLEIELYRVTFATDSDVLSKSSQKEIAHAAAKIKAIDYKQIFVIGHTDNIGSFEVNERLSKKRAQAVADLFMVHGLTADKIQVVPAAYTRPVADNATKEGRRKNRRVNIEVY